jgi:hypothetical protein
VNRAPPRGSVDTCVGRSLFVLIMFNTYMAWAGQPAPRGPALTSHGTGLVAALRPASTGGCPSLGSPQPCGHFVVSLQPKLHGSIAVVSVQRSCELLGLWLPGRRCHIAVSRRVPQAFDRLVRLFIPTSPVAVDGLRGPALPVTYCSDAASQHGFQGFPQALACINGLRSYGVCILRCPT